MIDVHELSFAYGKDTLFRGLNLALEAGAIYGLLGRNGAGKTSLLRILSGQLYAQEGESRVLGERPELRTPKLLSEIFFLPEEFHLPAVKPGEYRSMYAPFYPRFDDVRFELYVKEFELRWNNRLSTYSYGQKKKFLLAFGLASGCSLILLDEPTNGLDIPSKSQFRRLVASAISDHQTFVISTHQVRDMENLIDPIVILDEGKIIFKQSLTEVAAKVSVEMRDGPGEGGELYSEKGLGGYIVVTERQDGEEKAIDLELLFKAVISPDAAVRRLFKEDHLDETGGI